MTCLASEMREIRVIVGAGCQNYGPAVVYTLMNLDNGIGVVSTGSIDVDNSSVAQFTIRPEMNYNFQVMQV